MASKPASVINHEQIMKTQFKVDQQINIKGYAMDGTTTFETAVVQRTRKEMLPMPDGYVPVKFVIDGARLLVHVSNIVI